MTPTTSPPRPGDWYRHRTNFDICVTVIRLTDNGVQVRNDRKVETISATEWQRSFYLSK